MRVLLLGPFPPPWGGVQTHIVSLRDYLRTRGIPCTVANITGNRKRDEDEVYYPRSARELLALLRSLDYDIVHTHVGGTMPTRVLALLLATTLMPGKRSVLTFHSGGFPSSEAGRTARVNSLLGFVLRRLDAVIGVNPELLSLFRRLGVSGDRAHLVYPHSFGPEQRATAERGRDGLSGRLRSFYNRHRYVLLSVGLLEPEYDLQSQVDALGQLRQQYSDIGLAMIGSGSMVESLGQLVEAKPYRDHLLIAGDIPRQETLAAIKAADVLLRTTLYDGDAISVREALYIGTPVIATDNGMRPAGVHLVPMQDSFSLASAVTSIVTVGREDTNVSIPEGEENLAAIVDVYNAIMG